MIMLLLHYSSAVPIFVFFFFFPSHKSCKIKILTFISRAHAPRLRYVMFKSPPCSPMPNEYYGFLGRKSYRELYDDYFILSFFISKTVFNPCAYGAIRINYVWQTIILALIIVTLHLQSVSIYTNRIATIILFYLNTYCNGEAIQREWFTYNCIL